MMAPLGWIGQSSLGLTSPLLWALLLGVVGLWLGLSPISASARRAGGGLALLAFLLLSLSLPRLGAPLEQVIFWLLAAVTIIAAGMAISSRSPVYMAVWFALSLLGTAGLFLFQGSQFLGVATIVVYAGAIVVVFLFVLMLAQPQGLSHYDRASWGWFVAPLALLGGAVWIGLVCLSTAELTRAAVPGSDSEVTQEQDHMARFGAELFARHLVSVEVAGTLLLAALVGAVAIVIHGRQRPADSDSESTADEEPSGPSSDQSLEGGGA